MRPSSILLGHGAMAARALVPCCLLIATVTVDVAGQAVPFGKNKVQYSDFDWRVLSGPHVDVYYYPEEETLARAALVYAEQSFDTLIALFRHRPFRRVPLIIYSSHQHFEQTNVAPGFIPEGVAGFTEFLKRRIALPFNGSYKDFRHTIRHEMVHFFQLSKRSQVFDQYPKLAGPQTPLWWSEGLAERWSSEQDADDEMFIRDLVLSGRLPSLPDLTFDRSFTAYPLGGQIHGYLGERFGYGRVADLYESLWKHDSFADAFEAVYGISLKQLDQQWRFDLERKYFPMYADREPFRAAARRVLPEENVASFKPSVYRAPDGGIEVFYMSPRTGYTTIFRARVGEGRPEIRKVVQGERSEEFESLHFFDSRIDVARGKLVFVSKYLESDALFVWDLEEGKVVGRYQFPGLIALSSPAWSPDGRKVVFTGLANSGISDLYVLDFETQEHRALTDDRYLEEDADWSPDGRHIVFSSDRTAFGAEGYTNLFLYEVETGRVEQLTYGRYVDIDPRWSPDGDWILFTSSRSGYHDLYLVDRDGRGGRLTNFTGSAFDADWTPDGTGVVFSGFERGTFRLFYKELETTDNPGYELVERFEPPAHPRSGTWAWAELDEPILARAGSRDYNTSFSLDFAAGEAVFAPGFGSSQGVQFLASDLLGNHLVFLGIGARQFGEINDFFNSFSGQVTYLNLSDRVNWGAGGFRFSGRLVDRAFQNVFDENTFGTFFVASYPFSKFRRLEFSTVLERSDRKDQQIDFFTTNRVNLQEDTLSLTRKGVIVSNFVSYVKDNTLWLPTGPIDGTRWNLTGGLITDLTKARAESWVAQVDVRKYFRTSLLTSYAIRVFGYYSDGAIPQRIAFGGSNSLRLYPFLGLFGSRAWMVNNEWRFPITHGMALAFPFGTIRFPGVQGGLFVDAGQIWLEDRSPKGVWGSAGLGLRMSLGAPLVLRLDIGRRFKVGDLPTGGFDDFYGTEVDFFFGFNY